jgi:competence ComEA-like helix-hairpin-helix protein
MANKLLFFVLMVVIFCIPFIMGDCEEGQININTASAEDLDKIIWVGSVTAENIINSRPFESLDDLTKVSGIGEIKLQDIKEQGLACVEEEENFDSEEKDEEDNKSVEVVYVKTDSSSSGSEIEKKNPDVININPKSINTEKDNSKIINSKYALIGFVLFSILIILLSIINIRRKDRNEFD